MTATELLDSCRVRDIRLWAESGRLRFAAPLGALGPDLRAELAAHKVELLGLLAAREAELDEIIVAQIAAEPIPNPTVWRSMVATWSISKRQAWADRAESHQVAGKGWKEAEWAAFEETAGEEYPPDAAPREYPTPNPFPEFSSLPGREDLERAQNWNQPVDHPLSTAMSSFLTKVKRSAAGRKASEA